MKIIGITGGIGSGKSTVVNFFKELGIPAYVADTRAKELMLESEELKADIINLLGNESYKNDEPDREYIAKQIFNDREKLAELNAIIHPAVHKDLRKWLKKIKPEDPPYCIYEAAILLESGSQRICDKVVLVTSPMEKRIERVMLRDNTSRDRIKERMAHQWSDDKKKELADIVLDNKDLDVTKREVERIHQMLINGNATG